MSILYPTQEAAVVETSVPPPKGPQQVTAASLRTPCGIGDLPPEVLLKIFQFFNVQQLDYTISPVCQLWHNLSQRPCVRLELALVGKGPETATAIKILHSCPNLKDLTISHRNDADDLLHHVAMKNHELRRLAVNECNRSSKNDYILKRVLDEILLRCPCIVDLTITRTLLPSNKFYRDLGVRLPDLRKVNFNYCSLFGSDELRMILSHCGKLEEIRAVNTSSPLCDNDILLVVERLCGTLKVLEIFGRQLLDDGVAALGQCCQLRELHIYYAIEITDNGVFHLSRLRNLDVLELTGMEKVSSCGWVQLFSHSHWRQMKYLSLHSCDNVNNDTVYQVATSCPNLVKLNLFNCILCTEKGLTSVLHMFKNLEDLRVCKKQLMEILPTTHRYIHKNLPWQCSCQVNLQRKGVRPVLS